MSDGEERDFNLYRRAQRKALRVTNEEVVKTGYLEGSEGFPLMIEPNIEGINLALWVSSNRGYIQEKLLKHGALLFRDFNIKSPANFEDFIRASSGNPLEYSERSSPRSQVSGNIYTSTDHPADQAIFLHNEQSYNLTFPLRIFFFCLTRAQKGGETPIADSRRIYKRLNPKITKKFEEKGYMYVRNFGEGAGLTWQNAFQLTDKRKLEDYCQKNEIQFEWKEGNRLRTCQVRRAVASHPQTGEMSWFNHITFFNFSTLEPVIRATLSSHLDEQDLPNNTYYGDGAPIETSVLDELREAYLKEKVIFPWREGDVLMLDNMLMAHGREPYVGPRTIMVGMAEPFSWMNI